MEEEAPAGSEMICSLRSWRQVGSVNGQVFTQRLRTTYTASSIQIYLGSLVALLCALEDGISPSHQKQAAQQEEVFVSLFEYLDRQM